MSASARYDRPRCVALLYHPRVPAAREMAVAVATDLERAGAQTIVHDAWDWQPLEPRLPEIDWAVSFGGDGTMLRTAHHAAPHGIALTGVNFGRLAFLAELAPDVARTALPRLLEGDGWVDQRLMLRCLPPGGEPPMDALNEAFMGRGHVAHAVRLEVSIEGATLGRFLADGLIVATPTGTTAYSLSAGGPIVAPGLDAIVVTPVLAHPVAVYPLVVPADHTVAVRVRCQGQANLTVDGQADRFLADGDVVELTRSPYSTRFLRLAPPTDFYASLDRRLGR